MMEFQLDIWMRDATLIYKGKRHTIAGGAHDARWPRVMYHQLPNGGWPGCAICKSPLVDFRPLRNFGIRPICANGMEMTVDHIRPLYRGGTNELSNLQFLCEHCNALKGCAPPKGLLFCIAFERSFPQWSWKRKGGGLAFLKRPPRHRPVTQEHTQEG